MIPMKLSTIGEQFETLLWFGPNRLQCQLWFNTFFLVEEGFNEFSRWLSAYWEKCHIEQKQINMIERCSKFHSDFLAQFKNHSQTKTAKKCARCLYSIVRSSYIDSPILPTSVWSIPIAAPPPNSMMRVFLITTTSKWKREEGPLSFQKYLCAN